MNMSKFIKDRSLYIFIYLLNSLLILMIMTLSYSLKTKHFPTGDLIYGLLLSTFGLSLFLFIDYQRKKSFYHSIQNITNSLENRDKLEQIAKPITKNRETIGKSMDQIFQLTNPTTQEQALYQKLLSQLYTVFQQIIHNYQAKQDQHLYFMNQWVHQMKTPVSVMNLTLQEALDLNSSVEIRPTLVSLEEEVGKLAHGLEMILYTARINEFELDFKAQQVELITLIREVINQHKKSCIRIGVFPKIDTPQSEAIVESDAKWLRFVFTQIITNGIKYSQTTSSKGAKFLTVQIDRFGQEGQDGQDWQVKITDQGVGIPAHDLSRVFDPFFTGENGRIFSESTGMGLYLTWEICHKLGHPISIQSDVGEGTEVTLLFPQPQTTHTGIDIGKMTNL